jgi:hypothetical protein
MLGIDYFLRGVYIAFYGDQPSVAICRVLLISFWHCVYSCNNLKFILVFVFYMVVIMSFRWVLYLLRVISLFIFCFSFVLWITFFTWNELLLRY